MEPRAALVANQRLRVTEAIATAVAECDAIVTSGGAWTAEDDLVSLALADLGWTPLFRRVRMGPGKAVGFGLLGRKPVFILPGGPPSNLTGFAKIVLPGLFKLARDARPPLARAVVRLEHDLLGAPADWTQFAFGTITESPRGLGFRALTLGSRLQLLARSEALVAVPEGETLLPAGTEVTAELLGGRIGG
jgi:molybdopterin molybdotransferase